LIGTIGPRWRLRVKQPGERVGWDQETRSPGANERDLNSSFGLVVAFIFIWLSVGRARLMVWMWTVFAARAVIASGWSIATVIRRALSLLLPGPIDS